MVTLLPLPPNCKPFQIHYQMYLIRLSLNFNTSSLVVSCFYTYFSLSLLFQVMFTKDLRLKHEFGFFMSCIHTISFLCGVPKREYADISGDADNDRGLDQLACQLSTVNMIFTSRQ